MEISFSFGLGFVERCKTLNCWGYEYKTPNDVKEAWNHQIMWFDEELVDPGLVLGFPPKVLRFEVP